MSSQPSATLYGLATTLYELAAGAAAEPSESPDQNTATLNADGQDDEEDFTRGTPDIMAMLALLASEDEYDEDACDGDESDEDSDSEEDEAIDGQAPPPAALPLVEYQSYESHDPPAIDDKTDEQDMETLADKLSQIKEFREKQAHCIKKQRSPGRSVDQFRANLRVCASIQLKRTLKNTSRKTDIHFLTALIQPYPRFEVDWRAAYFWADVVSESNFNTIRRKEMLNTVARVWEITQGQTDRKAKKLTSRKQRIAYFRKQADGSDLRVGYNLKDVARSSFNLIPQRTAANMFARALSARTMNVKKLLHEYIMTHVNANCNTLSVQVPIPRSPKFLDILQADDTIPIKAWLEFVWDRVKPLPST